MSEHHTAAAFGQESTHHITPISTFVKVFGLLFLLMVATIAAAELGKEAGIDSPLFTWAMNLTAMGIAICKATLVVLYFMGVKFTTQLAKIYAVAGFVWVTLICIMFCDYATRHDEAAPGWINTQHSKATDVNLPEVGKEAPRQLIGGN